MSNYDFQAVRTGAGYRSAEVIDQGLRAYMLRIYTYMAIGVAITGVAALVTFNAAFDGRSLTPLGQTLFGSPLKWVVMLAPLAMVFFLSFRINRMSVGAAQATFWLYAALVGVSLATIFAVFTGESIVRVFFISAAAFGGLSLYGYTTSRSLSGWGSFLIMGLIGIVIASIVNIFLGSTALQFAISVIGVLVFAGLTAYDTQRLKEEYIYSVSGADAATAGRAAIMGALTLYLDFLNLFLMLLQLFGSSDD